MHISENAILVVGSANAEFIVKVDDQFALGQKNIVPLHEFVGGSGLNYTLRLINAGFQVFPILSIGNDQIGRNIKKELIDCSESINPQNPILAYIKSDSFLVPGLNSAKTFILKSDTSRTIFIEQQKSIGHFKAHIYNSLQLLRKDRVKLKCVVIGHIQSDSMDLVDEDENNSTQYIIDTFHKDSLIFANFGLSQISFGAEFWEKYLKKVSILQLNVAELRKFFKHVEGITNISECFEWLKQRSITAVITLGKSGAMATYKSGEDGVIFARALQLEEEYDSVGAGDAFCAGLVSKLWNKGDFAFSELYDAMREAIYWSGYACAQVGGAFKCPDRRTINSFRKSFGRKSDNLIDTLSVSPVDDVLDDLFNGEY